MIVIPVLSKRGLLVLILLDVRLPLRGADAAGLGPAIGRGRRRGVIGEPLLGLIGSELLVVPHALDGTNEVGALLDLFVKLVDRVPLILGHRLLRRHLSCEEVAIIGRRL